MPPKQPAEAAKAPKVKGGINKAEQAAAIKEHKSLFNSTPKSFAIGNSVQPVRNLSRYVKWPKCASPCLHHPLPSLLTLIRVQIRPPAAPALSPVRPLEDPPLHRTVHPYRRQGNRSRAVQALRQVAPPPPIHTHAFYCPLTRASQVQARDQAGQG